MDDALQADLLAACQESVHHQIELNAQLAAAWQMEPTDVYYHWCLHHPRAAIIPGTQWRYFSHGQECDMTHQGDGRFVRIEFGPGGRPDCLSAYSVLQFIMTSKPPWGYYPALQAYLADGPPPFTEVSGDFRRISDMVEPLYETGLIVRADPDLYQLQAQWTTSEPSGSQHVRLQSPYDDPRDRPFWDMLVCDRTVLAPSGSGISQGVIDG